VRLQGGHAAQRIRAMRAKLRGIPQPLQLPAPQDKRVSESIPIAKVYAAIPPTSVRQRTQPCLSGAPAMAGPMDSGVEQCIPGLHARYINRCLPRRDVADLSHMEPAGHEPSLHDGRPGADDDDGPRLRCGRIWQSAGRDVLAALTVVATTRMLRRPAACTTTAIGAREKRPCAASNLKHAGKK
jgi:hypothetical protein